MIEHKEYIKKVVTQILCRHTAFVHILVWFIPISMNVHFLTSFYPISQALFYSLSLHSVLASVFYFNSFFLLPRVLKKRGILAYLFSLIIIIAVMLGINHLLYNWIDVSSVDFHKHQSKKPLFLVGGVAFILFIGIILHLIKSFRENEKQKELLINEKVEAELHLLKSQVNPHFLLNTLNNIYALSLERAKPEISEMIMSLSEIIRYMLYETTPNFVPLSKELPYLKSYIELEKLRCEKTDGITVEFNCADNDRTIAPLLFIPFVENAFKHSRIVDEEKAWISISLSSDDDRIHFSCKNSIPEQQFQKDKTGGIGLENVRKRLELIYPNDHNLSIKIENRIYIVDLTI